MTNRMFITVLGAVAMMASACAGSAVSRPTTTAYVPRGQAAQPGSWNGSYVRVRAPDGSVRGRAAQPGSWLQELNRSPRQYATGLPAGRAAQPGGWMRRVN
jgi:hypothetical protein